MEQKIIDSVIKILEHNGRKSYEDVAREASKLGIEISVDIVNEIIIHLFQTKQIFGFTCVIDPRAFNLFSVGIWVRTEENYNTVRQEFIERAPVWGNIEDVCSLFGEYDFWIRMHTNSISQANSDIKDIISSIKSFDSITTIQTEIYRKYGFEVKKPVSPVFSYKPDNTDRKIISLLQQNCRLTDQKIAESLRIGSDEVSERIKRMENDSIILGYSLLVNPVERNMPGAIVEIHLSKKGKYQVVVEKLINLPEENVTGIYSTLGGEGHITLECFHNSIKELSKLIDSINNIGGIRHTKSNIIAEFVHKDLVIPIEP